MNDKKQPAVEGSAVAGQSLTPDEQLKLWVEGKSVHNATRNECCPDFSCCRPELLADKETRILFTKADEQTRYAMLGGFLGQALAGKKVYIAGQADQAQA